MAMYSMMIDRQLLPFYYQTIETVYRRAFNLKIHILFQPFHYF